MHKDIEKIEDLGFDSFFESSRINLGLDCFEIGRVVAEYKGSYKVKNAKGEFSAKITGKQIFEATSRENYPAVGDWVAITELDNNHAVIKEILPRKTIIKRKFGDKDKVGKKKEVQIIATNIDVAFVVESVDRDYNLNRLDRYFAIARDGGVKPAIVLNKTDLIPKEELLLKIAQIKDRFGDIDFFATSTEDNEGLNKLKEYIESGKTYCFLGSSGVGKSSLINKLLGEESIVTGKVSLYSDRGKHTTTKREMYFLSQGGILLDNPGLREVGLTDVNFGINDLFNEITLLEIKCKYVDCTHIQEPGCAVLAALKSGKLDENKYSNYMNLKKEVEYCEMDKLEKRKENRQFGKFIKNAKKELKNSGHKYF